MLELANSEPDYSLRLGYHPKIRGFFDLAATYVFKIISGSFDSLVGYRARWTEIWDSGTLVTPIWDTQCSRSF